MVYPGTNFICCPGFVPLPNKFAAEKTNDDDDEYHEMLEGSMLNACSIVNRSISSAGVEQYLSNCV